MPETPQGRAADDGARAFPAKRCRETVPEKVPGTKFVDKNLSRKAVPGSYAETPQGRAMDDGARAFPAKRRRETVPAKLCQAPNLSIKIYPEKRCQAPLRRPRKGAQRTAARGLSRLSGAAKRCQAPMRRPTRPRSGRWREGFPG
jgi:hypothetical protein